MDPSEAITTVMINAITVVPPTIMAFAALKSSQKVGKAVGDSAVDQGVTLADAALQQDSSLRLLSAILDRIDERLEHVEMKTELLTDDAASHAEWHRKGQPERRKS